MAELSKAAAGRMPLGDGDLDLLLGFSGWTTNQRQRLLRADHRSQARARRRRVGPYPPHSKGPVDLIGLGALNYDQTVPLPVYLRQRRLRVNLLSAVERFSYDPETKVRSEVEFQSAVDEVERELAATHDPFHRELGGSSYNVLQTLAWAETGLRLAFVGVSGQPPSSWPIPNTTHREALSAAGVECSLTRPTNVRGGRCASVVGLHGDIEVNRTMVTWPGANLELSNHLGDRLWDVVDACSNARAIHITSLFDADSPAVIADILEYVSWLCPGLTVSLDPGHVWATASDGVDTDAVGRLVGLSQLIFANETELEALARNYAGVKNPIAEERHHAQALLGRMSRSDVTIVVVKHRGAATVYSRDAPPVHRDLPPLRASSIHDDTGAGDAFAAGYLGTVLTGGGKDSAIYTGLRLARLKLQTVGLPAAASVAAAFHDF